MYNKSSDNGGRPHSPAMRGIVDAGADLLKTMYDVKIFFPDFTSGKPNTEAGISSTYPITVRATGFTVPDVEVGTYEVGYHGQKVNKPSGEINFTRSFDITFREDAAFDLRRRFTAWLSAVGDPVSGGISNSTGFYGNVQVATVANDFYAFTSVYPSGNEENGRQIFAESGEISNELGNTAGKLSPTKHTNPIMLWNFYHVWVSKVSGPAFETNGSGANEMTVTFQFMDCDMPFFAGNSQFESSKWTGISGSDTLPEMYKTIGDKNALMIANNSGTFKNQ